MEEHYQGQSYAPGEVGVSNSLASLSELLTRIGDTLVTLRHEFRGEELYTDEQGNNNWVQVTKPLFVRTDVDSGVPIKEIKRDPISQKDKPFYLAHDEAIEEVLSLIKMCGMNQVTAMGASNNQDYMKDLNEFENNLAILLTLKRKEWGIDKALRPMIFQKIKQSVQDARSLQVEGRTLKALSESVQRLERVEMGSQQKKEGIFGE